MSSPTGQSNTFVVQDVIIFDGKEFTENGFIVVTNGRIERLGPGKATVAKDTTTYSKPGRTIVPGLIDAHVHALGGNVHSIEQSIRFGVTTILDMHNEAENNVSLKKAETLISAWPRLASADEASAFVQSQIDESGASHIKLMHELGDTLSMPDLPRPPLDIQKAVVDAAHERGIIAVGHALSHAGTLDLLAAGVDGLAHCFLDKPPNDEWIKTMKAKGTHCNPTLSLCASQTGQGAQLQRRFADDPLSRRMLFDPRPSEDIGLACNSRHNASIENVYENTRAMYRAGVPLIVGSDAAGQAAGSAFGLGVHLEIYQLVHEIGMRPEEALRSATSLTAERFGFTDRGAIESGKLANLVLIEGDVRTALADKDVLCLPVSMVWREGVLADVYNNPA
ncbi:hypothetical protein SLS63_003362 [Diaporthe eres]|uniref:Amidohydrolase-related domain-containing protein n=1 Tax=Diaporthe eres TaxID=83184 RepID=A0ABR1PH23_DIAER